MYFGNASSTAKDFVVKNASSTEYKNVPITVQPREITPRVILGDTSEGVDIPSTWVGKEAASFTLSSSSVTISSQGQTATVTVTGSTIKEVGTSNSNVAAKSFSGKTVTITGGNKEGKATIYIVCADDTHRAALKTVSVTTSYFSTSTSLPTQSKQAVIMTLENLGKALNGGTTLSNNSSANDPVNSYSGSTYYVYAINQTNGTNDSATNNTEANLKKVGADWFGELNKPTTVDNHWDNANSSGYRVFGGPLNYVYRYSDGKYIFLWWYSSSNNNNSNNNNYWNTNVDGSTPVVVVNLVLCNLAEIDFRLNLCLSHILR